MKLTKKELLQLIAMAKNVSSKDKTSKFLQTVFLNSKTNTAAATDGHKLIEIPIGEKIEKDGSIYNEKIYKEIVG